MALVKGASMRALSASDAALVRCSICSVTTLVVWFTACRASAVVWPSNSAGVDGVGLDRGRELLHARVERVGGGLGAHLDLLGDVLGAADQQLLEAADAGVERVGDLERAGAERLVDLVDALADRLGELGAAAC